MLLSLADRSIKVLVDEISPVSGKRDSFCLNGARRLRITQGAFPVELAARIFQISNQMADFPDSRSQQLGALALGRKQYD